MPKLEYQVARTVDELQILKRELQAEASIHADTGIVDAIEALISEIGKSFDSEGLRLKSTATSSAYKHLSRERKKRHAAEQVLKDEAGAKVDLRLQHIWILRAGLAPPSIPTRSLADVRLI